MLNRNSSDSFKGSSTQSESSILSKGKKIRKRLYAFLGSLIVISVIVGALLIPQGSGSTMELSLNYNVGEQMVYATTNIVTAQQDDTFNSLTGTPRTDNSTMRIEVVDFDGKNYSLKESMTVTQGGKTSTFTLPLLLNVSKTDYYKNLITGAPDLFKNYTSNPTTSFYLSQSSAKVGDVWVIPVNTGNSKFGLSGELTLTFKGIQDLTVSAGTYKTFAIEISSNILTMHADPNYLNDIHLAPIDNLTLQLNGVTYLEQGTCRLIKSNLTQEGTVQTGETTVTSTICIEKLLFEHTKAE